MRQLTDAQKAQRDLFCAAALTGIMSRCGEHDRSADAMEAYEAGEALLFYALGVDECIAEAAEESPPLKI